MRDEGLGWIGSGGRRMMDRQRRTQNDDRMEGEDGVKEKDGIGRNTAN